ncbi:MAG: class B sortase [Clostridiales bacterium]|nr:class B sortase [Clostridiales bacterium]
MVNKSGVNCVEGRRRRAQRLTQNMDEQPELEEIRQQEDAPEEPCVEASLHTPAQAGQMHRRRNAQWTGDQPMAESEKPIPQPMQIDDGEATAHMVVPGQTEQRADRQEEKQKKRLSAPKTLRGAHVRRAAVQSAEAGKTVLKGLGRFILLGVLLAGEGAKKLGAAAKKLYARIRTQKKAHRQKQSVQTAQEYEIELIKPEDYHGRGQAHAQKTASHARKPAAGKVNRGKAWHERANHDHAQIIHRALSALLVCVVLVSGWQIGSILLRSIRTHRLNEQLSSQRAALMEAPDTARPEDEMALEAAPQDTPMPTPTPDEQVAAAVQSTATPAPDVVKSMKYRHMGGDALPEMAALYEQNRDLVAWVQIPDVLDLPVVYRDNDYYLTRDFNKQKNASGTIFLDENHPFKEKTQNLLLHGHNMKDGTMFGRLAQYLYDDTYIRNHPFIYFDTLWNKEQYVIVAILNVSLDTKDSRFFNYFTHATFSSDAEFSSYVRQMQLRSEYAIPIDVQPSDALLTLSTCLEDDRLVIVARRLRENETRSELRTLIRMTTRQ